MELHKKKTVLTLIQTLAKPQISMKMIGSYPLLSVPELQKLIWSLLIADWLSIITKAVHKFKETRM